MTTNQTIDGVPRELMERIADPYRREPRSIHLHNTDVAELRALLDAPSKSDYLQSCGAAQRVIDRLESSDPDFDDCADAVRLIRSLSAKQTPVELESDGIQAEYNQLHEIISGPGDCHAAARRVYAAGYRKYETAAQPQGEPVARITLQQVLKAYDYANCHPHKYLRGTTNWCAAVAHSLNAEQPAPVAVVLPERRAVSPSSREQAMCTNTWNACLDELKRLNPSL